MEYSQEVLIEAIKDQLDYDTELVHSIEVTRIIEDDGDLILYVSSECFSKNWLMTNTHFVSIEKCEEAKLNLRKKKLQKLLK